MEISFSVQPLLGRGERICLEGRGWAMERGEDMLGREERICYGEGRGYARDMVEDMLGRR